MLTKPSRAAKLAFGPFEFDAASVELLKHGYKVKLPLQPGQVLAALLDRPGDLVTPSKIFATAFGPERLLVTSNMASTRPSTSSGRRSAMPPINRAM